MQLFNQMKQIVVNNTSTIKNFLFWGGMLLNLILFIKLNDQKAMLSLEKQNLQNREYAVADREEACSSIEQYISVEKDLFDISMDIMDEKSSQLDEYNDFLQEQTDTINSQTKIINSQLNFISSLVQKVSTSENIYIPTPDEIENLCKLVYAEAGNQPYEGKVAVAEVVFNRIECPTFPDTINDVIFDTHQFSPCYDGKSIRLGSGKKVSDEIVTDEIREAVFDAWSGSDLTENLLRKEANTKGIYDSSFWEGGALYFSNSSIVKNYSSSSNVKVNIEDHCFKRK